MRYPWLSCYGHARQAMGGFSIWHWLIVLAVVLLIFGTKRLTRSAKDLGSAVKEFKKGMREDEHPAGQLGDQSRQANDTSSEEQRDDDNIKGRRRDPRPPTKSHNALTTLLRHDAAPRAFLRPARAL